jgi:hypothetical protein
VQVTSTTDPAASDRSAGAGPLLARLGNPITVGLIGFIGWLIYVILRWQVWAKGHISMFIMSGSNNKYSHPAQMFPKISHVSSTGYDGQFYYRFAFNPFNWNPDAYGITVDHNYRYTRIGYSLVAYIISLGGHGRLLPTVLVVVNLICVGAMAYLGAKFARESGRHALWGLLFVAYFGLTISVGRDTSEPLADALMLGGLLAYRHSRYVLAAVLVAYAVFTNEPILVLAVAIALARLYQFWLKRAKPGPADLIWVLPGAVYVLLQIAEKLVVKGKASGAADATANLTLPFKALVPGVYRDIKYSIDSWTHPNFFDGYDYNLIIFIALLVIIVAAFAVIRSSAAPLHEKAAFVGFVLVEMVLASGQFWDATFGDGRTFIDVFLLAVIVLLATPASAVTPAGAADAARSAHASLMDRVFAADRTMSNKRLAWVSAPTIVVLIFLLRRHILHQ